MAKQDTGFLGGFSGRLGPAVGYQWNGKWCLRARPVAVRNPRTEAQVRHRQLFKQQVQLAAQMQWAVKTSLTALAREAGMTAYNLFVSLNQPCFGEHEGRLEVDWSGLRLSTGPVAPVGFGAARWSADGVLEAEFEKNPLHLSAGARDHVYLYVHVPSLGAGYLAAPVYRTARRVAVCLPEAFAGCEAQLYGMVQNEQGLWSETQYIGALWLTESNENQEETTDDTATTGTGGTAASAPLGGLGLATTTVAAAPGGAAAGSVP